MNVPTRKRASVSKLQKGLTAMGLEFYYSKKPRARKSDFAVAKTKPASIAKARSITVKKK